MPDLFLIPSASKDFLIPKTYTDSGLLIEINPAVFRSSWYKAGFLKILVPVRNDWLPVTNKSILLTWRQIIEVNYKDYRLSFTPEIYLSSSEIVITPYQIQYNPMGINFAPAEREALGEEVVTTVVASTTNVVLDPANPTRREGFIVNKSNRNLWVKFAATAATAAAPTSLVPPNSNITIPDGYTGAINGIWSPSNPQLNCEVHQFNAV